MYVWIRPHVHDALFGENYSESVAIIPSHIFLKIWNRRSRRIYRFKSVEPFLFETDKNMWKKLREVYEGNFHEIQSHFILFIPRYEE